MSPSEERAEHRADAPGTAPADTSARPEAVPLRLLDQSAPDGAVCCGGVCRPAD
ncbi:hypothetical protein [Microbacterium album]|uniref:Uncharacterized protein n=1 Tax=Microbacterium album TaxID=2053191 RepID=A0A917IIT3_9MICO|nr:hypothetical protein [Microbacterium album]GGH49814.1 hypothetical protein GCM10010921_28150 [Microbacterium album]